MQFTLMLFHHIALMGLGDVEHVGVVDILGGVGRLAQALGGAHGARFLRCARARKEYGRRRVKEMGRMEGETGRECS